MGQKLNELTNANIVLSYNIATDFLRTQVFSKVKRIKLKIFHCYRKVSRTITKRHFAKIINLKQHKSC